MTGAMMMKIKIISNVACPWCYIGKRRLEKALDEFGHLNPRLSINRR
jgi:predicted DsbA family dithiol-disulfide isomerase